MKHDEWLIIIKMNNLNVLKVEIKTRYNKAEAVNIPIPHGQHFTIPIETELGEIKYLNFNVD